MAAAFDDELIFRISSAISDEARAKHNAAKARGYHQQYGGLTFWTPNVNIFRDPRWGRGQETYGEDPFLTATLGTAFVRGLQGNHPKYLKTAAGAKHYAVHSGPEALRHEFDAISNQKDLWETYLPAFEALVKADVEAVMCAYNRTNGDPCCAHKYLLQDVLVDTWGFDGHILSDCWAIVDLYQGHGTVETPEEAVALAIQSGVSLNCGSSYNNIPQTVAQGLISEAEIDDALKTLLRTRFKLGLFDPPGSNPYDNIPETVVDSDEHRMLSREAAQKSIVMLKNNGVLPLRNDLPRYFVTGPNAANTDVLLGNYYGVNPQMVTVLEGITGAISSASQLHYSMGALLDRKPINPLDWSSGNAGNSDATIVVLGLSRLLEGEEGESIASPYAGDRLDYNLPGNQVAYLKKLRDAAAERPIVAVITGGSPINLAEVHELADAVLFAWYPGEEGGNAVADIIFGNVSPSGRLPITFPKSLDQLPPYEDYSMQGRTYKYMNDDPLYPFGFGLSFSRFSYSNIELSNEETDRNTPVKARVTVKNEGERAADEVVQLYISDMEASVTVPNFQLNGFRRITLEPGESILVEFEITPDMLQLVNNDGQRILEPGTFTIHIGGTSPMPRSKELGVKLPKTVQLTMNN
jgi:beta-glucosidase